MLRLNKKHLVSTLSATRSAISKTFLSRESIVVTRHYADISSLKRTPLFDVHVAAGGKMVDFAGYALPIQYKDSIMEATQHCRTEASLFDVSHMLGSSIRGKDAIKFLEGLVVADLKGLAPGTGTLSVVTNEKGGIIDDTVITKVTDEDIYVVLNAGCAEKDQVHINKHLAVAKSKGMDVDFIVHSDRSLLAFQGPKTMEVLQRLTNFELSKLYFGMFTEMKLNGGDVWVTRTGYTGEDGFEISVPNTHAVKLSNALTDFPEVRLAALGPRDSLRLEAGLCLYGNDLNENITPPEAGLTWTIGKARREKYDFIGGDIIRKQVEEGVPQRRVGFTFTSKGAPARQHSKILDSNGKQIGEITSGGFSPVLQKNIAMGYVEKAFAKVGTELQVETRGKATPAVVTKMPFVKTTYYKPE
jgi:aminomethyltransferase